MTTLPVWIQILQALLTPLIALAVVFIAYRQWRTANSKLVLDLFDKRLEVYKKVRRAVAVINTTGKTSPESDTNLLEAMDAAEFLFGQDVRDYLERMWRRFIKLHTAIAMQDTSDREICRKNVEAQSKLFKEITQFYYEGADIFSPYMKMDHRVHRPVRNPRQRPEPSKAS